MSAIAHAVAALATAAPHVWPHGDPDAIARTIVAEPQYAKAGASSDVKPSPGFWESAWDWLGKKLGPFFGPIFKRLFGGVGRALSQHGAFGSAVGIALIAVSLIGIVYALVRLIVAIVRPVALRPRGFGGIPLGERGSVTQWRDVARAAAARGDFRLAIAALFAAAVAALDDRRILRFDASRTAGEYRRVVRRAAPPAAAPFDVLAERFVRASYAEVAATRDDFGTALGALDRFEPALPAAAEGAAS